ncbi:BTAD domain-containing putative transcriptional regulator [Streptomyces sp. B93]|uniref:AfsR/SARP family transcriptional regulator n=1 Tax=Streptomyces sp. B93 TaxID=2824875 RepID=UPI001B38D05D|nr:BTAD domain-containing putative transcriptional regulator [Streptomyces sp. B93]MBQ1090010.1 tetratricopeptide repeat protein [Streptomyces sp. B93]
MNGNEKEAGAAPTYGVLGPLLVRGADRAVTIGSPKCRVVMAALILADGESVPSTLLAEAVYAGQAPARPVNAVHQLVLRLRRGLAGAGLADAVATDGDGYRLAAPPGATDLSRWTALRQRADTAREEGDLTRELAALDEALAVWRGAPLADVPSDLLHRRHLPVLTEQRRQLEERRIDVALALGRYAEAIGPLLELTARQPLREKPWAQLMSALHGSGRRTEAIEAFHRARVHLREELGVEPGELVQRTLQELLQETPAVTAVTQRTVPRQLPAERAAFSGRYGETATARAALDGADGHRPGLVVVTGMPGVGKTSLAIHVARRVVSRYPDGQLWVNLRGASSSVTTPQQALTSLLRALGHPTMSIPEDPEDQVGLFRSLLDGQRVLIVLDDARSAEQVRPLLPGEPGCGVLVTSRADLLGLAVTDGAVRVRLAPLTEAEAREMLRRRLGESKVLADTEATARLLERTGRLPLALAVVAARAAARPDAPLAELDAQLAAAGSRLDALSSSDERTNLRAVFSWSFDALSKAAADVFQLLGLHPTHELSMEAAASLAGRPVAGVAAGVDELVATNIVNRVSGGRLALHELVHEFAAELADARLGAGERHRAVRRLLDHYNRTSHAAARTVDPARVPIPLPSPAAGTVVTAFASAADAKAWLVRERDTLLAASELAMARGLARHCWQLGWGLADFLVSSADWHSLEVLLRTSLAAGEDETYGMSLAHAHQLLGRALRHLDHPSGAVHHLERAVAAARRVGDTLAEARALGGLGAVAEDRGDWRSALVHDRDVLRLVREHGLGAIEAEALNHVGWDLAQLGSSAEALDYCTQSLNLARASGDQRIEAAAWDSLGLVHRLELRRDQALEAYGHALRIRRALDHRVGVGETHIHLGDAHAAFGALPDATAHWRAGIAELDRASPGRARRERARLGHFD